jgi:hypothetical protein
MVGREVTSGGMAPCVSSVARTSGPVPVRNTRTVAAAGLAGQRLAAVESRNGTAAKSTTKARAPPPAAARGGATPCGGWMPARTEESG